MKKPLIIHYHIFKNAGSTIDWILKKNFGNDALKLDDLEHPRIILSNSSLDSLIQQNPNIRSVSSHQLRFPVPTNTYYDFIPMFFIRHPIDRAFSIYSYAKRSNGTDYYSLMAKKYQLKEFIEFNLNSNYKVMLNFQTRFLSKRDNISDISKFDLKQAYDNFNNCVFGVVDRMDESLTVAEEMLKKFIPTIDLSYIIQNKSHERTENLERRIASTLSSLDDYLSESLISSNSFDFQLYAYANEKLDHNISEIQNFSDKLNHFTERCKKLMTVL